MKKISVIVPCYNQSDFLPESLESILAQTYKNWECIIVNDGSLDNTQNVAFEWLEKIPRFKYIGKKNGGLSSARNAGLSIAKGDYIQFLDADDLIHPDKFNIQLNALIAFKKSIAIAISDYYHFSDDDGKIVESRYLSPFLDDINFLEELILYWETQKTLPCHCFLIPHSIIKENSISFDTELPNHEDWLFWAQVFFYTEKLLYQNDKMAYYRVREISMCSNEKLMKEGLLLCAKKIKTFFLSKNANRYIKAINRKIKEAEANMQSKKEQNLLNTLLKKINFKLNILTTRI